MGSFTMTLIFLFTVFCPLFDFFFEPVLELNKLVLAAKAIDDKYDDKDLKSGLNCKF